MGSRGRVAPLAPVKTAQVMAWQYPPDRLRGYFIEAWRKHRGFTQEQLAGAIGMTAPSISQMEAGKQWPSQQALEAMAVVFLCEPGDILRNHPLCPVYRMSQRIAKMSSEKRATTLRLLIALEEAEENTLPSPAEAAISRAAPQERPSQKQPRRNVAAWLAVAVTVLGGVVALARHIESLVRMIARTGWGDQP